MGLFSGLGKLFKKVVAPVASIFTGDLGGAVVGGISSLLGGAKEASDSRDAVRAQNAYNDPAAVRARYEAAGLNPLLAFGGTSIGQQMSVPGGGMGTGIANAGALVADELARNSARVKQIADLEKENAELKKKAADAILRPKMAGVYGTVTPDKQEVRQKLGQHDAGFIGPREDVRVTNLANGRKMRIPAGLADQLDLSDGGYWTAEHHEAIGGDFAGEFMTNADLAQGVFQNATGLGPKGIFDVIRYDDDNSVYQGPAKKSVMPKMGRGNTDYQGKRRNVPSAQNQ